MHTHMTNTRSASRVPLLRVSCAKTPAELVSVEKTVTDPEILERRYPTILHQFSIRSGSGGNGQHRGGEGVVREIEFLE